MTQTMTGVRPVAAPPGAMRVACIDTLEGMTALRPEWNELLQASAANGPFLTWEWLHAWWTHLRSAATLKVVTVRDGGDLIAIAPFMATASAASWFSQLEFVGAGRAGSDYLDVIVRTGRETAALRAIAGFIETQQMTLRLDRLPEASLGAQLGDRLAANGWVASAVPDGVCPFVPLAGHTWDSYLATLGSAHRANVRRRLRAAGRQFQMHFAPVTSEFGRREALEALGRFHERRFAASGGSTAFFTPALRAFHAEAARRAHDGAWLRMYVLWLDDVPAAVMYGFLYNRRFFFYQHGFDDRYAPHSVGLVVMALTIRAAIDEGAQAFDFLWGAESYKRLWAGETRTLRQIRLFPPHAAGRLHRCAVTAQRQCRALARRVLTPGRHRAAAK